jgi:hypothetical protein
MKKVEHVQVSLLHISGCKCETGQNVGHWCVAAQVHCTEHVEIRIVPRVRGECGSDTAEVPGRVVIRISR